MNRKFETKQIEAQHIVGIRTTATMDKIGEVMGPMFGEVYGHIQQSGQAAGRSAFRDLSLDGRQLRRFRMRNARSLADPRNGTHPGRRTSRRNRGNGHPHGAVRCPPADVVRANGVDGVAGPPTRRSPLGGLRHRPRRRARPVKMAHGYLLSGEVTGVARGGAVLSLPEDVTRRASLETLRAVERSRANTHRLTVTAPPVTTAHRVKFRSALLPGIHRHRLAAV